MARTARGGTGGRAGSAVLAAVAAVESRIAHALDPGSRPRRGVGATPAWLSDASAVADVVGAALNALRFVLMREGGSGPAWKGSPPAGAWARRRELIDTAVTPAAGVGEGTAGGVRRRGGRVGGANGVPPRARGERADRGVLRGRRG